ncbi:hypothetical protein WJX84_011910 [Apatococcus fuscideae]|uniref:Cytochrome P450 n=1 Tax=Apatococcus fuscideae TaxID=2026836 RepID=A0AAW1T4C6_9CHLO
MTVPFIRSFTFIPAMKRIQSAIAALHAEQAAMVQRLRACQPPPASLGAHLLALTDPATGKPLTDGQLGAELATFVFAGINEFVAGGCWRVPSVLGEADAHAWDQPEAFLPERWDMPLAAAAIGNAADSKAAGVQSVSEEAGPESKAGRPTLARRYLPFSYGPRSCVGQNLANMTMVTFTATICANFTLALAPEMGGKKGVEEAAIVILTLQPKDGMLLHCSPRNEIAQ